MATTPFYFNVTHNDFDGGTGSMALLEFSTTVTYVPSFGARWPLGEVVFVTPDDGVSHDYNINAKTWLIDQSGYFGFQYWNTKNVWTKISATGIDTIDRQHYVGYLSKWDCPPLRDCSQLIDKITIPPNTTVTINFDQETFYDSGSICLCELSLTGGIAIEREQPAQVYVRNKAKGSMQVMFSSRPFSAFNFDTALRTNITGAYAYSGSLGLGTDKNNFVVGYITDGKYGIAKVRGGLKTVLIEEANATVTLDTDLDLRFWHKNGLFGLEVKPTDEHWAPRGSGIVYEWAAEDGQMAMSDDLFYTGVWSFIDPPRFRTTGFRTSMTMIPVMPLDLDPLNGDSDFITDFPSSGTVDIEGVKYDYTGKLVFSTSADFPVGPVQLRSLVPWKNPWNKELDGSHTFPTSKAVEIYEFRWLPGSTGHDDYEGAILASNAGYSWLNGEVQWKTWITTGGAVVLLKSRSRHYSATIPEYYPSTNEKIWITNGLTGVTPSEILESELQYSEGSFIYLDSDDKICIRGYYSTSLDHDNSIASLLDKFTKVAGTQAVFPGDYTLDTLELDNGETQGLA